MRHKTKSHTKQREITCCVCKNIFLDYVGPSELLKQPNRTCSRSCFSQHMQEIRQRRSFLKECPVCKTQFRTPMKNEQKYCNRACMTIARTGHEVSLETRQKIGAGRIGENNPFWKGGVHLYSSVHHRLKRTFGVADKCENIKCRGKSITFDWALKRDMEYEFKRDNFYKLCRSCHRLYDYGKIDIYAALSQSDE